MVVDNQVSGTVNIVVTGDIPREEAIRIIEINLLLNGITLIPVENSDIERSWERARIRAARPSRSSRTNCSFRRENK
ncbi:MAG: hypothetical protein WDN28_33370 [Chthoniobacter sp.]